jgi:hypothetical protein
VPPTSLAHRCRVLPRPSSGIGPSQHLGHPQGTQSLEQEEFKGRLDNIAVRLSLGGESVVIDTNIKGFGSLTYFVDGVWISQFGIGEGYDTRGGREPNYFHDALTEVGLGGLDDGTLANPPRMGKQTIGVLTMLTKTLGIRLPHDLYAGPLPTASRTGTYFYQPHR